MQKKKKVQVSNRIKISSTARTLLIVFAITIFALGSGNLLKLMTANQETSFVKKELYKYTNQLSLGSKINLKKNEYIKEEEITDKQTYLSDLISDIDLNLNYNYIGSDKEELTYNYKLEAIVSATYNSNGMVYDILNKVETLKESESKTETTDKISINEFININYSKYHQMIKDFKQTMGLSANSHLYVRLTVNTKTNINSQEVQNAYVQNYDITLGDKIAIITQKEKDETSNSVKYDVQVTNSKTINAKDIVISSVGIIVGLILLRIILTKTEKLNSIRNEYKLELNRIMRSCESKLVEIEDLKQIDIEHATRVKDITQLLKLSDEALVPIYCCIKEEPDEEAYFFVTKYEKSYVYILR
ncbi:MAG: hypothetical protein IKP28_05365 [Clostridia bacterium]|nr:hypothetical protein [Clostridia bacterium]